MRLAQDRNPACVEDESVAGEADQRWLARELHDGPAQSLAAALYAVDLAISAVQRRSETAVDELRATRALVRDALDDVRALMVGFRPFLLDERGLLGALHALGANLQPAGPELSITAHGITESDRLPAEIELALYRIAQESLSNARRHALARRVVITVTCDAGEVTLAVADDGRGFTADTPAGLTRGEGLASMRERARLLGGECEIVSDPGHGTRVTVRVPMPSRGNGAEEGRGRVEPDRSLDRRRSPAISAGSADGF